MLTDTGRIQQRRRSRVQGWWIAAGALALTAVICVGIVWVGAQRDDAGNPIIDSPATVIAGFLSLLGAIATGVIAKFMPTLAALKENLQNDHRKPDGSPLYLRDDLDEKHDQILAALADFRNEVRADIGGLLRENRDDRADANARIGALNERVRDLERKEHP